MPNIRQNIRIQQKPLFGTPLLFCAPYPGYSEHHSYFMLHYYLQMLCCTYAHITIYLY